MLWEHDVAGSNPVIPTKKAESSHSDRFHFLFWVRFPSSMFAFRKPNLVSPLANVSFRPKKRTLTLGEVCFFVGMTDRLGSVRLADAGSHTACGIYGAQRSIPCHFSAQIPVFDVCLPQTESCFAFGECFIPTKKADLDFR